MRMWLLNRKQINTPFFCYEKLNTNTKTPATHDFNHRPHRDYRFLSGVFVGLLPYQYCEEAVLQ